MQESKRGEVHIVHMPHGRRHVRVIAMSCGLHVRVTNNIWADVQSYGLLTAFKAESRETSRVRRHGHGRNLAKS